MKKSILGLISLIIFSIFTYAYGLEVLTAITGSGRYEKITILQGESRVFGFSRKIENIIFSKDSGFTIRTLEGGKWRDLSDNISDYSPITGILVRNISYGALGIDATYTDVTATGDNLFQKSVKAGWNLISPAYESDIDGIISADIGLGTNTTYSEIVDFTGNGFINSLSNMITTPYKNLNNEGYNNKAKSELTNVNLIEKFAYGLYVDTDTTINGSQQMTDTEFLNKGCNSVYGLLGLCTTELLNKGCDEVSQLLGLCTITNEIPASLQATNVGTGSIDLTWDMINTSNKYIVTYGTGDLNLQADNKFEITSTGTTIDYNIFSNTTYNIKVKSYSGTSESVYSNQIQILTN